MFMQPDYVSKVKRILDSLVINANLKADYDSWHVETMIRDVIHQDSFLKYSPRKVAVAIFLSHFFVVDRTDPDYKVVFVAFFRATLKRNYDLYDRYEEYTKICEHCAGNQYTVVLSVCRKVLGLSEKYDSIFYTFFIDFWLWIKKHTI